MSEIPRVPQIGERVRLKNTNIGEIQHVTEEWMPFDTWWMVFVRNKPEHIVIRPAFDASAYQWREVY